MADSSIEFRRESSGPSEVFGEDGKPFSHYGPVLEEMGRMGPGEWGRRVNLAHERLLGVQRDLGIPDREDKTYPTDYVPRLLPAAGWEVLERGLTQRMLAINEWLRRLERGNDEVVPVEILDSSVLFDGSAPTRFGGVPNRQMGFDVVAVESG